MGYQSPPSSESTEQPWFLAKYVSLSMEFCHGSGALCALSLLGEILTYFRSEISSTPPTTVNKFKASFQCCSSPHQTML